MVPVLEENMNGSNKLNKPNFRKIDARKDLNLKSVRNRFDNDFNCFSNFLTMLSNKKGYTDSGIGNSYAWYVMRLILIYEECHTDKINSLVNMEDYFKLESLTEDKEQWDKYDARGMENGFPKAALKKLKQYILYIASENDNNIDLLLDEQAYIQDGITNDIVKSESKRKKKSLKNIHSFNRNLSEALKAKEKANWQCEIDPSHETFTSPYNNKNFVEGHHLIPMAAQIFYDKSIDFADNIISLCPNCHRKIHNASDQDRNEMLLKLFDKRKNLLKNHLITITFDELRDYYF